jgi:enoyl-CoA hydratase/carnithine racemase
MADIMHNAEHLGLFSLMSPHFLVDDSTPRVRVISMNRPERLNALDGHTLLALRATVEECSGPGRDVRVIVIRGEGRAFCSGSDLKWIAESGVLDDAARHLENQDRMQAAYESLEAARQVVIACVHGYAVAGGLELALACDIVVADQDAQLGDEHIRKNLFPSGGSTQRLPRRIGAARALYYLLSGRRMSGREAERIGLAALAVPGAELKTTVMELANEIARADPHALAAMKFTARRAMELPLKDGLALERWMQFRYRNESPAMVAGVQQFAAGAGISRAAAGPSTNAGDAQ